MYCYKGHAQSVEQLAVNPSRTKVNNVNVFLCVVCLYVLVCLSVSMCITVRMFVCVNVYMCLFVCVVCVSMSSHTFR